MYALTFWAFMFLVGYLISGVNTGLVWLAVAMGLSLVVSALVIIKGK